MRQAELQSSRDVIAVMTAIVALLEDKWPDAVHLSPASLPDPAGNDVFMKAALALQDEGAIMYEALLIDSRPCLRDAILTRKGQQWYFPVPE